MCECDVFGGMDKNNGTTIGRSQRGMAELGLTPAKPGQQP